MSSWFTIFAVNYNCKKFQSPCFQDSSLAYKYYTRVEVSESGKHPSLLQYGNITVQYRPLGLILSGAPLLGRPLVIPTNIRLGWKSLLGAYYENT